MAVDTFMAYDAAVIERRADGKVRITKKHETPTRVGGVLGGGVGLATGLVVALFPFAAVGAGLSRGGLKELGEHLDAGQAGLVVVGCRTWAPRSSRRCAGRRRCRPSSSRPTPPRSNATPGPQAPASR
jgi:hypothetical protein